MDYYIPIKCAPILKTHPVPSIFDSNVLCKYFDNIAAYSRFFTMPLVRTLTDEYIPDYVVTLGESAPGQISFPTTQIQADGSWLFPDLLHKYLIALHVLKYLDCLYKNAGERFGSIGERGEKRNYNKLLKQTINSLIMVQFEKLPTLCDKKYKIIQQSMESIQNVMEDCGFVIYTDPWEQITVHELEKFSKVINIGVIKITKKPLKKLEDILAPLHDEYIFFYSKDVTYLEKLSDFSVSKNNLIMGVELKASIVSVNDYLKFKVGNEQ